MGEILIIFINKNIKLIKKYEIIMETKRYHIKIFEKVKEIVYNN
jgi:hypothetical protein